MGRWILALLACTFGLAEAGDAAPAAPSAKAELKSGELKLRIKALSVEAAKADDLWTLLQIEAYGQDRLGLKSNPVLGGTEVIGSPLLACPQRITAFWDRGDYLAVVAGQRYYQLAADGRPVAVSTPLLVLPSESALSLDGRFLAAVERRTTPSRTLNFSVRAVPNGAEVFRAALAFVSGDDVSGHLRVAEDGSAAVVCVLDENDAAPRLFVANAAGTNPIVKGYFKPLGIGAGAKWAIAEPWTERAEDYPRLALLAQGGEARLLRAAAMGPGVAVVVSDVDFKLQLVKAGGEVVDVAAAIGLSKSARLQTIGRWLVVGSGWNAKTPDSVDLLGNVSTSKEPQPYTTAFYRWSDLAGDQPPQPAYMALSPYGVAEDEIAAAYVWNGKTISALDLTGNEVVERPFAQASEVVDAIACEAHLVRVRMEDENQWEVFNVAGHQLWFGEAHSCTLFEPGWALLEQGEKAADCTYEIVALNADPAKRTVAKLQLEPGRWEIEVDRFNRRAVATRSGKWVELDPATGKARRNAATSAANPRPATAVREDPPGRFAIDHARIAEKTAPPSDDPLQLWSPRDAWRVGQTLVVLDHHARVFVSGKKRGSYVMLGWCEGADHLALFKDNLVLANDDNKAIASFAPGPALVRDFPGRGLVVEPLPAGPWKVKEFTYTLPHGGMLLWDPLKSGFAPRVLRSPPASPASLLALTSSVIFDLDANSAKLLGSIEKLVP